MTNAFKSSIALVGMSNIGKTYWARRLAAERGYAAIGCDALIEARLKDTLAASGTDGVARWMGQPYHERYAANCAAYLAHEAEALRAALAQVAARPDMPHVIDTTGSVIYLDPALLEELRRAVRVIYFEASQEHLARLFRQFSRHPKPLVWGDSFAMQAGETRHAALKRCYGDLLAGRAGRYRALAHIAVPYAVHHVRQEGDTGFIAAALGES